MICALLDFEKVNPYNYNDVIDSTNEDLPTFRCKMPNLPSDVPHMMGFELLQAQVWELGAFRLPFVGTSLFLLDNAENTHNNTLTNEILLTHLNADYLTNTDGNYFYSDRNMTAIKIYISTKQNYLYFNIQNKFKHPINNQANGNTNRVKRLVNTAKMIVRLTFDTKQNEYQPKRIML